MVVQFLEVGDVLQPSGCSRVTPSSSQPIPLSLCSRVPYSHPDLSMCTQPELSGVPDPPSPTQKLAGFQQLRSLSALLPKACMQEAI